MNARDRVLSQYEKIGLVAADGRGLALHRACPNASVCWKGCENRMPSDDPNRSAVALPFVGKQYDELRLLVLGINQNDWGGLGALDQLVADARAEIRTGRTRVFQNPEYSGSPLWHRVGCFGAAFAEAAGLMSSHAMESELPTFIEVDAAYEFLAFTNHVKCSPTGDRSKPTEAMWAQCGQLVLPDEVRALNPRHILVLGLGENALALSTSGLKAQWSARGMNQRLLRGSVGLGGEQVPAYAVAHPSMPAGLGVALFHELRRTLQ